MSHLNRYSGLSVTFCRFDILYQIIKRFRNGKPLSSEAGADIIKTADGKPLVKMKEARLYKIIQDTQSGIHTLEFIILKPWVKAFIFTFGNSPF